MLLDPILHEAEVECGTFNEHGPVKGGRIVLTATSAVATTTLDDAKIFGNEEFPSVQAQRRMRLLSSDSIAPSKRVVDEIVFDVTAEAREGMEVLLILLQTLDLEAWLRNGVAGVGVALQASPDQCGTHTYSRVGCVKFTAALTANCRRQRLTVF